jgi:Holliday junction resolvase RusA-like endonuclease
MNIRLRIFGTPASQGSKRWLPNGRMIEADKKLKPWRAAVHEAVYHDMKLDMGAIPPMEGPVAVRAMFLFERPRHHYRTGKNANLLRDGAPTYVTRTPDVDKCLRALLDPLTEMGVWKDDSQVVIAHAAKRYCNGDERPGAIVTIIDSWGDGLRDE